MSSTKSLSPETSASPSILPVGLPTYLRFSLKEGAGEEEIFPLEPKPGQAVGHQGRGGHGQSHGDDCHHEGIFDEHAEGYLGKALPAVDEIFNGGVSRYQLRGRQEDRAALLKAAAHHPDQGVYHDDPAQHGQNMVNDFSSFFPCHFITLPHTPRTSSS